MERERERERSSERYFMKGSKKNSCFQCFLALLARHSDRGTFERESKASVRG
jgi:hypothetical protein